MQTYNVPLDYTWNIKISSFDVGQDRRMKLSSILKYQQEVGEIHFGIGGLGFEELVRNGMAFVITRTRAKINRMPLLNEHLSLTTWHRNSKGAQFFRCYRYSDTSGNPLIESVSAFALVDPETHRILRPSEFLRFGVSTQPGRINGCPDPDKIQIPENLIHAGIRRVGWSDIDYNGHLNNTVYADIVADCLPRELRGIEVSEFSINFLSEALEGEEISLKTFAEMETKQFWLAGDHQRGRCFEASVNFAGQVNW